MSKEDNLNKGNEETQFTSENQPSGAAKSAGKQKKRLLKDLAAALISGERLSKCKDIAQKVGLDLVDEEYTLEVAMTLKQIEIALDGGDTKAFIAAMDRLVGKPKQETELNINELKPLSFQVITKDDKPT